MARTTKQQLAESIWTLMQEVVFAEDRTDELRDELGLGRGSGRVKVLLSLTDGAMSLGRLADAIGADAPYATLIVNDLEGRGLVTRSPDPDNRRRKTVALTEAGSAAANKARGIIARPPASLRAMSAEDLRRLAGALERLPQR